MQLSLMAKSVSSAEKKWPTSARNRMGTARSWCPMRLVALVSPEGRSGLAAQPSRTKVDRSPLPHSRETGGSSFV